MSRTFLLTASAAALALCAACTNPSTGETASANTIGSASADLSGAETTAADAGGVGADTTSADAGALGAEAASDPQAGTGSTSAGDPSNPQGSTGTGTTGTQTSTGTGTTGTQTGTGATTGTGGQASGGAQSGSAGAGSLTPVTQAEVRTGATVRDQSGRTVGTVQSVNAEGAVISTGTASAIIPFNGLARSANGLVTSATRADIEGAAKSQPQAKQQPQ